MSEGILTTEPIEINPEETKSEKPLEVENLYEEDK